MIRKAVPPSWPIALRLEFYSTQGRSRWNGTECRIWTGSIARGYGQITVGGKNRKVHRLAWESVNGPALPQLHICYHCDVKLCINPKHLFQGTPQQNKSDAVSKRRHAHGETHFKSRLTAKNVREIRKNCPQKETVANAAKRLDVSTNCIRDVINRTTWTHLP